MEQNSFDPTQGTPQGQVPVNNYPQAPMQNPAQPPYQTPYYNNAPQQPPQPPQKKKKSVLSCCLIGLAIVLGILIGGFFLIRHFIEAKKAKTDAVQGPAASSSAQISYDENGDFLLMSGNFGDTVKSQEDALKFLSKHAWEIGIKDASAELRLISEYSFRGISYYRYQQVLNDVPVYGNDLILTVSPEGKARAVNGTYTPVNADTTPSKTQEEAEAVAKEYAGEDAEILSDEFVILPHPENGHTKLAYNISVIGESKFVSLLIDADNCEIVYEAPAASSLHEMVGTPAGTVDVSANGKIYSVELDQGVIADYDIADTTRNIVISDADLATSWVSIIKYAWTHHENPLSGIETSRNTDGSVNLLVVPKIDIENLAELVSFADRADFYNPFNSLHTQFAVGALNSIQNSYDFYNRLGWKSTDGNGKHLNIVVGIHASIKNENFGLLIPTPDYVANAGYIESLFTNTTIEGSNAIIIGAVGNEPLIGHGILGHEFTHGVIQHISRLNGSPESRTINEGYADVMGSLISGDWEFSVNELPEGYRGPSRSAVDPNKNGKPCEVGGAHFVPFTYIDNEGKTRHADEHENATIISHSAYLMSQKGLSNDELTDLFFNSMYSLPSTSDYHKAAMCLISSADSLNYPTEKQIAVREALYKTKMYTPEGKTRIYVHCGNRALANAAVLINGKKVGRTDKNGRLVLDFDPKWFGKVKVTAEYKGYESITQDAVLVGGRVNLDFDLARPTSDRKSEGEVKVTILDFTEPDSKEKAKVYYLEKGSKIDLFELVDKINKFGFKAVKTDGTKLYFENGSIPVDLSYRIYGTNEAFDFDDPILEDVVIEPVIGIGEDGFSFQDFIDIKEGLEGLFSAEDSAVTE